MRQELPEYEESPEKLAYNDLLSKAVELNNIDVINLLMKPEFDYYYALVNVDLITSKFLIDNYINCDYYKALCSCSIPIISNTINLQNKRNLHLVDGILIPVDLTEIYLKNAMIYQN